MPPHQAPVYGGGGSGGDAYSGGGNGGDGGGILERQSHCVVPADLELKSSGCLH